MVADELLVKGQAARSQQDLVEDEFFKEGDPGLGEGDFTRRFQCIQRREKLSRSVGYSVTPASASALFEAKTQLTLCTFSGMP